MEDYLKKGGKIEDTVGRKCLCNALVTNIGMGQRRPDGYEELPMLTSGDDIACILEYITPERQSYHARDVVKALLPAEESLPAESQGSAPTPEVRVPAEARVPA